MAGTASKLVKDLTQIPNIVGGLGLSIAAAQKAFNLDYLESLERIVVIAQMLGDNKEVRDATATTEGSTAAAKNMALELLRAVAPPRYQFTETTLSVKLDLAQTMDLGVSAGLGLGFGGIAVNAAMTLGYGYDYRAAAEVVTVLHAHSMDHQVLNTLLARAKEVGANKLTLPERSTVDTEIWKKSADILEKLTGERPKEIEEKKA